MYYFPFLGNSGNEPTFGKRCLKHSLRLGNAFSVAGRVEVLSEAMDELFCGSWKTAHSGFLICWEYSEKGDVFASL